MLGEVCSLLLCRHLLTDMVCKPGHVKVRRVLCAVQRHGLASVTRRECTSFELHKFSCFNLIRHWFLERDISRSERNVTFVSKCPHLI
jgi:hypothetical protein